MRNRTPMSTQEKSIATTQLDEYEARLAELTEELQTMRKDIDAIHRRASDAAFVDNDMDQEAYELMQRAVRMEWAVKVAGQ